MKPTTLFLFFADMRYRWVRHGHRARHESRGLPRLQGRRAKTPGTSVPSCLKGKSRENGISFGIGNAMANGTEYAERRFSFTVQSLGGK